MSTPCEILRRFVSGGYVFQTPGVTALALVSPTKDPAV
eukprot:CAMPEP_0198691542 /NCGR_PEP_ID=MMETSP1468-20131203/206411_1 /TAXON_ID=1461545 /ORGANISM="Mantoniella sp, Strain CCMP1436" /LENGTH=37 /DNA_ID= /DNA_START= /DNA_END= /DNA_ORIENTATION=